MDHPIVATRDEWLAARKQLLAREREFTRERDALNAERRKLPRVKIDKQYIFEGPDGRARLLDLFEGRRQLIVYHFMFESSWDEGCPICSFLADKHRPSRPSACARHLSGRRIARAAVQDQTVQSPHGLDIPVVFVLWQRLQLVDCLTLLVCYPEIATHHEGHGVHEGKRRK